MILPSIRAAITAAGGTPTQVTIVGLLRELVTAFGGTPTQFTTTGLLREAVTAKGGTPTQFTAIGLLRELLTAGGVTPPTTFYEEDFWAALASIVPAASFDPNLEWSPDPGFDDASKWTTKIRCDVNVTNASELTTTTTSSATLGGTNAPGIVPPDGTYRFTVGAADHISTTLPITGITPQFGGGFISAIPQATLAAGGSVDLAVTGCTTTNFGFALSNKMYAIPSISCKRIA